MKVTDPSIEWVKGGGKEYGFVQGKLVFVLGKVSAMNPRGERNHTAPFILHSLINLGLEQDMASMRYGKEQAEQEIGAFVGKKIEIRAEGRPLPALPHPIRANSRVRFHHMPREQYGFVLISAQPGRYHCHREPQPFFGVTLVPIRI